MINHSPASVLMPFHVYSQKTVHLEFSLVRGFNSETTELKSKELLRHHFLAKNHGKTCKSSTVEIWNLCASCGSAAAVDAVELCEAQFFLAQRIALFFVEAKCGRKIREKGTQPCHNVAFCFEGDNYGRWQGRQGTEVFLKPFDPLCCTSKAFATGVVQFFYSSVQANGGYGKGGRVMVGCRFRHKISRKRDDWGGWKHEREDGHKGGPILRWSPMITYGSPWLAPDATTPMRMMRMMRQVQVEAVGPKRNAMVWWLGSTWRCHGKGSTWYLDVLGTCGLRVL